MGMVDAITAGVFVFSRINRQPVSFCVFGLIGWIVFDTIVKKVKGREIMKNALVILLSIIFVALFSYGHGRAEERVTVRDGVIHFSEQESPDVQLSKIEFNIPPDSPKEILELKGKIYRGECTKGARLARSFKHIRFLFLRSFDPKTNLIVFHYVFGAGASGKPGQDTLAGTYSPGSPINLKRGKHIEFDTTYKLEIQGDKLRFDTGNGWGGDFLPVATIPVP